MPSRSSAADQPQHLPLADRYTSKVLSHEGPKRIGMTSLGALLNALSLRLVAVPDLAALERNRARYVRRDQPHTVSAKKGWGKRKIRGTITGRLMSWPPAQEPWSVEAASARWHNK